MTAVETARAKLKEQNGEAGRRFARAFTDSRSQLQQMTRQGINNVEAALRELRGEIQSRLQFFTGVVDDPFLIAIVPEIEREIRTAINEFTQGASAEIAERMETAFDLGGSVSATAMMNVGVPITFPTISPTLLSSLSAASADRIAELSTRLGDRIIREIRLSAAGLQPASLSIRRVTDLLRSSELRRGVRKRIGFGFQAEAIVRTELGRVYSNAQQAASEQIADTIPDLRKRWVTTLNERRGHRAVEERYKEGGEIGPIPIKQRFRVTDFSRSDFNRDGFWTRGGRAYKGNRFARRGRPRTDLMLFPRDPSASAGNTVFCTCVIFEILPEIDRATQRALGVVQTGG